MAGSIAGSAGDDTIDGGSNNDTINGLAGADTIVGKAGDDFLLGDTGDDSLVGGDGNDSLEGGIGYDRLFGGNGNDTLDGGGDSDTLGGGAGNDTYLVASGDSVGEQAGEGYDTVRIVSDISSWSVASNIERVVVEDAAGGMTINGNGQDNDIRGNSSANTLSGAGGNDSLAGADGGDMLEGGNGDDKLAGGLGNDLLAGGTGNDVLTGGAGLDTFRFDETPGGASADQVRDFTAGEDLVQLSSATFTRLSVGEIPANLFVLGRAARDADDRLVYSKATGELYYDPDGTGGKAKLLIADFGDGTTLTAADIQVF